MYRAMRDAVQIGLLCILAALTACAKTTTPKDADAEGGSGAASGGKAGGTGGTGGSSTSVGGEMCKKRAAQASQAVQTAADDADLSCARDADCEIISNSTDCWASCGVLVSARGKSDVQAAIDALNAGLCKGFEGDGCKVVAPPCDPPSGIACVAGRCQWREAASEDAGAHAQQDAAVQNDAGTSAGCLAQAVKWGMDGGLVARHDAFSIEPCRAFAIRRTEFSAADGGAGCENEIASTAMTSVVDVNTALAHPDVAAAIAAAPMLYGGDSRPVDGQVLRIELGKAVIEVGDDCGSGSGMGTCKAIPPGVAALRATLAALTEQQQKLPDCDALP